MSISVPVGAAGATVFWGGAITVAVAALVALALPSMFVAVTTTRTVCPTSACCSA